MEIALSIDTLLEKDFPTQLLNTLCKLLPTSPVYTVIHRKSDLGLVQKRNIYSSFLSHKIQYCSQLGHYFFAIPSACAHLFIPCKYKLVINISRGLSHGIKRCEEATQITYLYDDYWTTKDPQSFREKIFKSYVENWSLKMFCQIDELWVSSVGLYGYCKKFHSNVKIIPGHSRSELRELVQCKIKALTSIEN